MKKQILWYSLSIATATVMVGCNTGGGSDGCNTEEPDWTSQVAPMTSEDDAKAAATVVHAVDVVTGGELLGGFSVKTADSDTQNSIDALTKLLTPDMSAKNEKLAALREKKSEKNTPSFIPYPEGPQECSYGGTVTITTEGMIPNGPSEEHQSLTYSFNDCVEDPEYIGEVTGNLFYIFGQAFEYINNGISATVEDGGPRVTLNGKLSAEFTRYDGVSDLPAWVGPPSWSSDPDEGRPDTVENNYLRGEINSDDFSATFTTGEESSMRFESDMNIYFEDRYMNQFLWNDGPRENQIPEAGFFNEGWYLIIGANGCLELTATEGPETYNVLSMRTLGLEAIMHMDDNNDVWMVEKTVSPNPAEDPDPLMLKLDGFLEISSGEGDIGLSFKADDFYRGYDGYWTEEQGGANIYETIMMGYLGSDCMGGMLFVEGAFTGGSSDNFPDTGYIAFFAQVPDGENPLGTLNFSSGATLNLNQTLYSYHSWSDITSGSCSITPEP